MALTTWPVVLGEDATLEKLHEQYSLARVGDGEAALMRGGAQVREPANAALAAELRQVVQQPHPRCLVGIPRLIPGTDKYQNWLARVGGMLRFLQPHHIYYSSFISRPDSAPHIRTRAYAQRLVSLWQGKRTVLVSERDVAIFRLFQKTMANGNGKMLHIPCPHTRTYAQIDQLEAAILRAHPDLAILSCGPAATCLANRLTGHGLQAIDLGSAGGFLLKELYAGTQG